MTSLRPDGGGGRSGGGLHVPTTAAPVMPGLYGWMYPAGGPVAAAEG